MIQEGMDDWVADVRAKLKAIKGPETVCLVYMTEQHDGGQANYCEVYKDEKTARAALSKAGFNWMKDRHPEVLLRKDEFSSYPDTATIVPDVRVKTDE